MAEEAGSTGSSGWQKPALNDLMPSPTDKYAGGPEPVGKARASRRLFSIAKLKKPF